MTKTQATPSLGQQGEEIAALYLEKEGYRIVEKNYRKPFGEVDIIARDGEVLTFVEVKTRTSSQFGSPFAAVDQRKQQQLIKIALYYIVKNRLEHQPARFDVVAVWLGTERKPVVELVKNAFGLTE